MAIGDYSKTTYVDGNPPALNAGNLNNSEDKVEELDTWAATPTTDTIGEATPGAGVTIDGVLLKDSTVNVDTISEKTSAAGITIDGLLIKDGAIPIYAGLFPDAPIGLTCSNAADADHDITISAGGAADSTRVMWLALASAITKQIDAAWAEGNNAGGMDTGSVAANSVYYIWLIRKDSDGSIDALFSLSSTAPTMPAGYTYKRRIMTVCTDAGANIRNFTQINDRIYYTTTVNSRAQSALANTNRNAYTLHCPPSVLAIVGINTLQTGTTDSYFWIGGSERVDAAASITNFDVYIRLQNTVNSLEKVIKTNASSAVYGRGSNTDTSLAIFTIGWIDDRGRNA